MKYKTDDFKDVRVGAAEEVALEYCLADFTNELHDKLIEKMREGRSGWDEEGPDWNREVIKQRIIEHLEKGDMRDVANLAMFAWNMENSDG